MAKPELIRCKPCKNGFCWVQVDGSHIFPSECTCKRKEGWECPIDAHSIKWRNENPMWGDPAETKPAPSAAAQELRDVFARLIERNTKKV